MLNPQNQIQKDIAKRFIVKNIESQILFDYNKLKEFKLYSNLTFKNLGIVTSRLNSTSNISSQKTLFINSLKNYIPTLTEIGINNLFLRYLKQYASRSNIIENTTVFKTTFSVNTDTELQNLNQVPPALISTFIADLINATFEAVFKDYLHKEFVVAGILSLYNHNIKVLNPEDISRRIANNSTTLSTSFSVESNMTSLKNIISSVPQIISSLGINYNGKMDSEKISHNLNGIIDKSKVDIAIDLMKPFNMLLNNILGQCTQLCRGFNPSNIFIPTLSTNYGFGGSGGYSGLISSLGSTSGNTMMFSGASATQFEVPSDNLISPSGEISSNYENILNPQNIEKSIDENFNYEDDISADIVSIATEIKFDLNSNNFIQTYNGE